MFERRTHSKKAIIVALIAVILCVAIFVWRLPTIKRNILEESRENIKNQVLSSAVECYAVEGAYPESLEYLEKNYSLVINHDAFIVDYKVFAENLLPNVKVLVKGEE